MSHAQPIAPIAVKQLATLSADARQLLAEMALEAANDYAITHYLDHDFHAVMVPYHVLSLTALINTTRPLLERTQAFQFNHLVSENDLTGLIREVVWTWRVRHAAALPAASGQSAKAKSAFHELVEWVEADS